VGVDLQRNKTVAVGVELTERGVDVSKLGPDAMLHLCEELVVCANVLPGKARGAASTAYEWEGERERAREREKLARGN